MTRLKISIAMCTYNGETYLREQLDSIVRQTRLPDELLVCDDNSTDMTVLIINDYTASAPFSIKLFKNDTNIGSTSNFEQAIRKCEGDIIVLSDQDDVWHQDKLTLIEQVFLDSEELGAVFSNGNVVSSSLTPLGYTLWDTFYFNNRYKTSFKKGKAFEVLLNHNVITGATMAFRSNLRETILPIPPSWVHDAWIAIVISTRNNISFIDQCLIDYRQHNRQQIGGKLKNLSESNNLARSVTDYNTQIQQYLILLNNVKDNSPYHSSEIYAKINHLIARSNSYNCKRFKKLYMIFKELISRRYFKYSKGLLSACKDICLTKDNTTRLT